jgi:hypothetical protein
MPTSEINERTADVEELNEILRHLDNGGLTDPEWQGRGIRFMLRRFRYVMVRETVTPQDLSDHVRNCPANAMLRGDWKTAMLTHAPWALWVAYLLWSLYKS